MTRVEQPVSPFWKSAMFFQRIERLEPEAQKNWRPGRPASSSIPRDDGLRDVWLYLGLFALSVAAFLVAQMVGRRLGVASDLIAIAGNATCGWSWLLVRALFQSGRDRAAPWPLGLVLGLVATGAVLRFAGDGSGAFSRVTENLSALVGSALLLLAAVEPLMGLRRDTTKPERWFRLWFSAGYVAVLLVAVIWVNGAPEGSLAQRWGPAIKSVCAVIALVGMGAAVWRRGLHPLGVARLRRGAADDLRPLGDQLTRLMTDGAIHRRHNLKVADIARRLGEPDYKVTQCVTGVLGFSNANQMINHFRVEDAKRLLADPALDHLPILTLAYDCGFSSVGPFNRAFKGETGMTPQQFRRQSAPEPTSL